MPTVGSPSVTGIPGYVAGGIPGQVLSKTSSSDRVTAWATRQLAGERIYMSNQWYDSSSSGLFTGQVGNLTLGANRLFYAPIYLASQLTIKAYAVYCSTTQVSQVVNFGVLSVLTTGRPGALIAAVTSGVGGAASAQQAIIATPASPVIIPAGWNYIAVGSPFQFSVVTAYNVRTPLSSEFNAPQGPNQFPSRSVGFYAESTSTPASYPTLSEMNTATYFAPPTVLFQVA